MKILLFVVCTLTATSISQIAFAQSSYDINIPTGAGSPDAPYFWQSEKDGSTTGDIDILVGDKVVWKNADTVTHTVTSGTPEDGPDGLFDTGLFPPGKNYPYTFTEKGSFPYYCVVHPWMTGNVFVTEGFSIIPKVGKNIGDGLTTFDVEYKFNRLLSLSSINESEKSITLETVGNPKSDNHDLLIRLPSALIDGPFAIWVDGKKISDFNHIKENDLNVIDVTLTKDTKIITLVGTTIVPEFGVMALTILGISILIVLSALKYSSLTKQFLSMR